MRERSFALGKICRSVAMVTRNPRQRCCALLWPVTILLQGCSHPHLDHPADPVLLGCWHFVRQTVQEANGNISERDVDCTAEYLANRLISQCLLKAGGKGGGNRHEYSYRIIRDGVIESKIVADSASESDVGTTSEVEYEIEGDHLKLTAHQSDTLDERTKLTENLIDTEVLVQEAIRQKIPDRHKIPSDGEATRALYLSLLGDVAEHEKPSDAEVQGEYDRERELHGGREYRVRHIVVETEGQAREVIAKLDRGEDFVELAKGSIDPRSAARGGDLGWGSLTTANPAFIDAIRDLRVGDYTSVPVQTPMGWHVIRLDEVRMSSYPGFDEVRGKIAKRLLEGHLKAYIEPLKASAAVVRY